MPVAITLLCACSSAASAQQPAAAPTLSAAPEHAWTCDLTVGGTRYGSFARWSDGSGARRSRDSLLDRGYAYEVEQETRFDAGGDLKLLTIRGTTSSGPVEESYSATPGGYWFKSLVDEGSGPFRPNLHYVPFAESIDALFNLAEAALRSPSRSVEIAPGGKAELELLGRVQVRKGAETKELSGYQLRGGFGRQPIWFDGATVFGVAQSLGYGRAGGYTCLPRGWEHVAADLKKAQDERAAERASALVSELAPVLKQPVAFKDVRLFVSRARSFAEHMTVVVEDGVITAVGKSGRTRIPRGARVVPGAGRTLLPGLWDSHLHFFSDEAGTLLLSQGITSVRDPGNFAEDIIPRMRRIEDGRLLGPRVIPMMIIDGPGPLSVFVGVKVSTEAEALEAVRLAKRQGFAGVKTYGSLDPKLVPGIVAEAKRLGLRMQGHVPHGMRALDAVMAGYDEINHGNFLLLQAAPDEVINRTDTLERHYGPMRLADQIDVTGPSIGGLLDEIARRGVVVDATLSVLEHLWTDQDGNIGAAYRPIAESLDYQFLRGQRQGGIAPAPGLDRPAILKAFGRLKELLPELRRKGVRFVAGSDMNGLVLAHELELYVEAGLTPAEALASATIAPAEAFGLSARTGSVEVGKLAELVLVQGDPGTRISDIRNVELILTQKRLMEAARLRRATGLFRQ
jgi:hypothetical protein